MPTEGNLDERGEPPQAEAGGGLEVTVKRDEERGLGKVHFGGDQPHHLAGENTIKETHGRGIPRKRPVRESVDLVGFDPPAASPHANSPQEKEPCV